MFVFLNSLDFPPLLHSSKKQVQVELSCACLRLGGVLGMLDSEELHSIPFLCILGWSEL